MPGKGRKRQEGEAGPLLSSTVIVDTWGTRMNRKRRSVSNGDDHSNGEQDTSVKSTGTSTSSISKTPSRRQKGNDAGKSNLSSEQKNTIDSYSPSTETDTTSTTATSDSDVSVKIKSEPTDEEREKKRVKVARGKGFASEKSVGEFKDPNYIQSSTLWGTVGQGKILLKVRHPFKTFTGILSDAYFL